MEHPPVFHRKYIFNPCPFSSQLCAYILKWLSFCCHVPYHPCIVCLPTFGWFVWFHVGKYTGPIDGMGVSLSEYNFTFGESFLKVLCLHHEDHPSRSKFHKYDFMMIPRNCKNYQQFLSVPSYTIVTRSCNHQHNYRNHISKSKDFRFPTQSSPKKNTK